MIHIFKKKPINNFADLGILPCIVQIIEVRLQKKMFIIMKFRFYFAESAENTVASWNFGTLLKNSIK